MTERLYYHDSRLTSFDATVLQIEQEGDNAPTRVRLDRSAFYPASGGQPADTGVLGCAPVSDVVVDAGEVWHVLAPGVIAPQVGTLVQGEVDWTRRHDMMQQHSGQHLLSQVFVRLFGWETLSVHMGEAESTLDLETPTIERMQIEAAEAEANRIAWQATPIRIYFVDGAEIERVPLRKPPKVSGLVRIVEIADYDWSACGGTHCATTAEIAPIRIVRSERRRGGVRLTFLCGERALAHSRATESLLAQAAAAFSTDVAEVPTLVARTLEKNKEQQRRLDELNARLLAFESRELLADAEDREAFRLVRVVRDDLDANGVRLLASILAAEEGIVALVAARHEGKTLLAFARNADSTPASLHMGKLLRDALGQVSGKGGGRPDFAQGGGVPAEEAEALVLWARSNLP